MKKKIPESIKLTETSFCVFIYKHAMTNQHVYTLDQARRAKELVELWANTEWPGGFSKFEFDDDYNLEIVHKDGRRKVVTGEENE